jgi:O-antigen/teichoic acid export membrane protein
MSEISSNAKLLLAEGRLGARKEGWNPAAIATDIATLGIGTLLAGLCNVALVFVVPKLISLEQYGYWRLFGLYAGYVGFLHFGFVDGALLRWAGRPIEDLRTEIGISARYLFWQHVLIVGPLCVIAWMVLPTPLRFVAIAVAIYAPIYNITATLQFGLQGARIFWPVAASTVAAPALFLGAVLLWTSWWPLQSRGVILFFLIAWCVPLAFLLSWAKPWGGASAEIGMKRLALESIRNGWPIVMTNTGVILVVYSDRMAVSWAATIQNFAQYSLAASAMSVPVMAIQACSKVLFSHLAVVTPEGRKRIYGIASRALLTAWMVLLPYYFALDAFVRHILPKYIPSLAYARILLLGIPFLAAIQILQISYAYLNGRQKRLLAQTVVALAVSLGCAAFAAYHTKNLGIVAGVQVAMLGLWWIGNEWTLRTLSGQSARGWAKFATMYVLAAVSYWLTTGPWLNRGVAIGVYYLGATIIVILCFRDGLNFFLRQVGLSPDIADAAAG